MINIIIFSLLMCILHTDAAEGPGDDAEGAAWFTGKAAAINCGIVQSKLANYIAFKESMMLQVCCSLFQSDYHWFEGTSAHAANHKQAQTWQRAESLVKIDIDVILHILRKKSESNAEELAATFSESDDKVYNGEMIYHAFVRCVPDFEYSDVEKMLTSVPQLIDRPETLKRLKRRYSRKMEEKFSSALRHLLWRKDYSLKVPSDLKPHKDICSIALADCPFVQQFVYYYQQLSPHPMHCDFVYSDPYMQNMQSYVMDPACAHQYLQQYQQPMHGAFVPQWGQPMRSGVMMPPGCAPQLRNADLEQYLEHLRAYVYRGDKPRLDSGEPDYVAYAYAGKKVEIEEELPNMLDRIAYTVKNKPGDEVRSCEHNVRARLLYIKNSLVWMNNLEKAMIFAWAFVMERKADEAFYALGFLQDDLHDIHYLWISWRLALPNYLYALMECTNIKGYGEEMRSSETCLRHQKAQDERCSEIPTEDLQSYISKWEQIMDMRNYRNQGMRSLFNRIFPKGDAPDAIVLKKFL